MVEILEIIFRWHRGETHSAIQRALGTDRKTVRKYIGLALQAGIQRHRPLPPDHEISALLNARLAVLKPAYPTPALDRLVPYHATLERWAKDPAVSIKQMWRLLGEEHPDLAIGFTSLREYVRLHLRPLEVATTVPLDIPPGQQAQVDFGYAGRIQDPKTGKLRKAWCFVMTLSYSRYRFARYVFDQKAETWVDCHARAFEFFGAVPRTVLCDNLKAGVLKCDLYDPLVNRLYQECERHYGFAVDPAKVRTPQHKGRVERTVGIVNGQVLAGREVRDLDHANELALAWSRANAQVVHSVTRRTPLEAFEHDERSEMLPLPAERFECARWATLKVGRDQHVVFEKARYSVPTRYVGELVEVRGGSRTVRIHHQGVAIKLHEPAPPGGCRTDLLDFPDSARYFLEHTPAACGAKAAAIGPGCEAFVGVALARRTVTGLRKAQKVLRLAERYGAEALEAACCLAVADENWGIPGLEALLGREIGPEEAELEPPGPLPAGFGRPASYFVHDASPAVHA